MFRHENDAQNVVTGWFTTKICSKGLNSSKTLHKDNEIIIGSLEVQNTNNCEFGCY